VQTQAGFACFVEIFPSPWEVGLPPYVRLMSVAVAFRKSAAILSAA